MKKIRYRKILFERYLVFKDLIQLESDAYGYWPNYRPMKYFHDDWAKKILKLNKEIEKFPSKHRYDHQFITELLKYNLKMYRNGEYYSTTFLKTLIPVNLNKKSLINLLKHIKYFRDARMDTLMGFIVMRARLEEMILNLFFLFKSKNLIKLKKWNDLFVLIHKINYSNYDYEIGLKIRKRDRKFKNFLEKIIKKDSKLHINDMIKFVISKKTLKDDYRPSFYASEKEAIENQNKYLSKKEILNLKRFSKFLDSSKDIRKFGNFSLKPIVELYSLLSDELHPNNLFLRNILTSTKSDVELSIILKDHIQKLYKCSEFITDTSEIIYKQNIGILDFFINKIDGSKKDKLILDGFNQSVQNNLNKFKK